MNARLFFWQALVIVGLVVMLLGAFDPLEGSLLILPGSGLVALGSFLGKTPERRLLCWAFVLVAVGVGAMFGLSAVGGIGGQSGHSVWWLLTVLPYPAGWLIGLGGVLALVGKGWHRRLFGLAMTLSVMGLGALILLCPLLDVVHKMPHGGFSLIVLFVIVPHGIALITALSGGVVWMIKSFRAAR
jgi:hypothetical protein